MTIDPAPIDTVRVNAERPYDVTIGRGVAFDGVVAASDPYAELVETDAKMSPMKTALRGMV